MLTATVVGAQDGGEIQWRRGRSDPSWLQAETTVPATADRVWALVRDVSGWPALYRDIRGVHVISHRGARWSVHIDSAADDEPLRYDVTVDERRRVVESVLVDQPTRVRSRLQISPGPAPDRATIRHGLSIEVGGVMSLFVTDARLDREQRRILRAHLADIRAALRRSGP